MSCDYGLLCTSCNQSDVPDNLSQKSARHILNDAKAMKVFWDAYQALFLRGDIFLTCDIGMDDSDLKSVLEFVSIHAEHELSIIDEYGRVYQK
jgi:hypothetical protein